MVGSIVNRGMVEDWVQIQSVQVSLKMVQLEQFLHNLFSNSIPTIRKIEALLYAYKHVHSVISIHLESLGW